MTSTAGNVYSIQHAQCFRVNASGSSVGQLDPNALVNDTTSHAYKLKGPVTFDVGQPTFIRADFRAGTRWQGSADMGMEAPGEMTLTVNDYDSTLNTVLLGGAADTTSLSGATISSSQNGRVSPYKVGWLLSGLMQSRVSATSGTNFAFTWLVPSSTCRVSNPGMSQDGGTNPQTRTITINPAMATKFPNGIAFGANQSFENNEEYLLGFVSNYTYGLTTYVQNAIATTYILGYRPYYSTVTSGTTNNWTTVNGAATAATSIDTTTGVVTLAAAGTAAQLAIAFYPTLFTAI